MLSSFLSCYEQIKNMFSNKIIIIFENEFYDVTELQRLHPNGEKIFKKYHMKDITNIYYNNFFHKEIKKSKKNIRKI